MLYNPFNHETRGETQSTSRSAQAVTVIADPVTFSSYVSSHLDGVTDDYFSRDPVSDTFGICEQLLEVAVRWIPLASKLTAALCWWEVVRQIPITENRDVGKFVPDSIKLIKMLSMPWLQV